MWFVAEVVDLSGLSLRKIKPEWILPALGSSTIRRVSRQLRLSRSSYPKRSISDSEISVCSDGTSELMDDNGDDPTDHSSADSREPDGYSTPKNRSRRYSRGPDIRLPTIRSPMMMSEDVHDNMFPYHEDGPRISPSSFVESVFGSPPSDGSPSRHRRYLNLYAKPVFESSITGAKSIPFHDKCKLNCAALENSDSIFPPITNDFCKRAAHSMRRPSQSRSNSRAPSPLPGIVHDTLDVRYFTPPQQDFIPVQISNSPIRVLKLNLSCNGILSLDSLDADGAKSRTLHERLRTLKELELHQNNLESLPDQLFRVSNIIRSVMIMILIL